MSDMEAYIQSLLVTEPLAGQIIPSAIQSLGLPLGSHGLDAGCGIGLQALSLAKEVGPEGHVTGLDLSPELLSYARGIAAGAGLAEQVAFKAGDVRRLPFADGSFDWAWSANCVGYAPLEPLPLVRELARVVKPGGKVAILAWSSEMLLPGFPLLEARLSATSAGMAPFGAGMAPESHFLRALGWFRAAGLEAPAAKTFLGQACAPLSGELRQALMALIEMRWPGVEVELSVEDCAEYRRLCLPESPDFILHRPDYYAFFTYSMFSGWVPERDDF
jgi:ubiquinone/menaquinone biosynthesis C-methylase UbiE